MCQCFPPLLVLRSVRNVPLVWEESKRAAEAMPPAVEPTPPLPLLAGPGTPMQPRPMPRTMPRPAAPSDNHPLPRPEAPVTSPAAAPAPDTAAREDAPPASPQGGPIRL